VTSEVFTAVKVMLLLQWDLTPRRLAGIRRVSEKHTVYIFKVGMAMLEGAGMYAGLEVNARTSNFK
jgi:hypothetical protein